MTGKRTGTPRTGATQRGGTGRSRLVSLATAAEHAEVSVKTLRRYITQGRLTGYRVGPRLVRVDLDEVDQLARPIPTARDSG